VLANTGFNLHRPTLRKRAPSASEDCVADAEDCAAAQRESAGRASMNAAAEASAASTATL